MKLSRVIRPFSALAVLLTVCASASAQLLDYDEMLKPLVDTSSHGPNAEQNINDMPATSDEDRSGTVSAPAEDRPIVLTGKIQTLQDAIVAEAHVVDWYAWYLACRDYLARTGGLQCDLGTNIKFHRGGRIEAMTMDPACLISVRGRHFDLPEKTRLEALILPVRNGYSPPATRKEIYQRVGTKDIDD